MACILFIKTQMHLRMKACSSISVACKAANHTRRVVACVGKTDRQVHTTELSSTFNIGGHVLVAAFCLAAAAAAAAVAAAAAAALLVATALALLAAARADTRLASLLGSPVPGEDPGGRGLDPGDNPGPGELLGSGAEMGGNNAGPSTSGAGSGAEFGACIMPLLGTTSLVLAGMRPAVDSAAQFLKVMSCAVRKAEVSQSVTSRHLRQACQHSVYEHALVLQPGHCLPGGPCVGSQGTPLLGVIGMLGVMPVMGPGSRLGIIYLQGIATTHKNTSPDLFAGRDIPYGMAVIALVCSPVCSCPSSKQQQHQNLPRLGPCNLHHQRCPLQCINPALLPMSYIASHAPGSRFRSTSHSFAASAGTHHV